MALRIAQDFNLSNERYLRSLVANATGDGEYAQNLSYGDLRMEARRIKSVANKILKSECRVNEENRLERINCEEKAGVQLLLFR